MSKENDCCEYCDTHGDEDDPAQRRPCSCALCEDCTYDPCLNCGDDEELDNLGDDDE